MKKFSLMCAISLLSIASLTGCADRPKPQGKPLPNISFTHLNPIALGGPTRIKQSFVPSQTDAGQELFIPLTSLLHRYAVSRLAVDDKMPASTFFDIEKASVMKTTRVGSMGGMIGGEDKYSAAIVLTLTPQRPNALQKSYTIQLNRDLSITHSWSLAEKEAVQMQFLEGLVQEIDQQINIIADRNGY